MVIAGPCISPCVPVPALISAAMAGQRPSLSRQRLRLGPMLPTGMLRIADLQRGLVPDGRVQRHPGVRPRRL